MPRPTYIGKATCAECHETQLNLWQGSHHDLAMQVVSESTMLGDFEDVTFEHRGVNSRFFRRDDGYFVETEGPKGVRGEYRIAYLFGVTPLQQYLIEFPNGRYQTLPLCWDSRPIDQGGQRWFHLYPDERIAPDDELYWTGPLQNWNLQCAECHSTNLKKNYDRLTDSYHTTFAEINVSCEACHGPGSNHAEWARAEPAGKTYEAGDDFRLAVRLKEPQLAAWVNDPLTQKPKRTSPLESQVQLGMCARCHSRRGGVTEEYVHGVSFLQTHRPALLDPTLYHADGQIQDEVYVWGSFVQSKMFQEDVRCVDCHDPHSGTLVMPQQQLCMKCHQGDQYAGPEHHFHEMGIPGAPGVDCVDCHMPQRTYMVVDPRRDHSFRVPRPDLSVALGTPNACNDCHEDQTAQWAADATLKWYGPPDEQPPSAAPALHASATGRAGADAMLMRVTMDEAQSTIMRATALMMLRDQPSQPALEAIRQQVKAQDPLLRMAATRALAPYPPELRWEIGAPLLDDEVRLVRIESARILAADSNTFAKGDRTGPFKRALKELRHSLEINADRPSTLVDLANLHLELGQAKEAEQAYREALQLQANYVPASINLADLFRDLGREDQVLQVLREALQKSPDAAALHHSLGLAQVRANDIAGAMESLSQACVLSESAPQYVYVYAIALNSTGRGGEAIGLLEQAMRENPGHRDLLYALATIGRDQGRLDLAIRAAQQL
ncbi:MAG: ammonia-forming cytochrome c nitrite reductase subunit c552, partial [Planctomycetota bacterium]|nr:ammonia-forming cytochrome c nitrite reductase subunit c552 [Planctomycetota bacterium]